MSEAVKTQAPGRPARPVPSALWLWSLTSAEVAAALKFVAERRILTVFLGVGWAGPETHAITVVERLRAAGVGVQCLGGDPSWLERPDLARQWMGRALRAAKFDAIHLDVEPWTLPGWASHRERLLEQYLAVTGAVRESGLPLEIDVAPRLASDKIGSSIVLDPVLGSVDRVTVMAYRDHAEGVDGILEVSQPVRAACFRHEVGFRIGVETQPAEQAGGPGQTFAEEGRAALQRETAVVSSRLTANPFYLGVAVHDWHHWSRLS